MSSGYHVRVLILPSGEQVRVIECGDPSGVPVLLIHGWTAWAYMWRRVGAAVAADGVRVILLDVRGHGLSDKPTDPARYATQPMLHQVLAVLDALGIDRAVIGGHSMGGALALDLAHAAPQRVAGMLLVAPVGLAPINMLTTARLLSPGAMGPDTLPRWVVALGLRLMYGKLGSPTAAEVEQYWAPSQFPEYMRALRLLLHHFDWDPRSLDRLRAITVPTRVMLGTADRLMNARDAGFRAQNIPAAVVRFIEGGGHLLPEETPLAVRDELRAVLSSSRTTPADRAV